MGGGGKRREEDVFDELSFLIISSMENPFDFRGFDVLAIVGEDE